MTFPFENLNQFYMQKGKIGNFLLTFPDFSYFLSGVTIKQKRALKPPNPPYQKSTYGPTCAVSLVYMRWWLPDNRVVVWDTPLSFGWD